MKRNLLRLIIVLGAFYVQGMATPSAMAFALLGPFESWMEETNGLRQPGDIGGPMDITNGYRWNVPVLTYGFDQSFLDFFGSNGVAAVKSAVQILNDVPPASQIVPTNFPFNSQNLNYAAQAKYLYDLKSETLSLLLEQMGLAQSTRYIFVLRQWNPIFLTDPAEGEWPTGTIPNYIVQRNFDPQTFSPSVYVNQCLYSGYVSSGFVTEFSGMPGYGNVINILLVDPLFNYLPVADFLQNTGIFYTGLTYDDVGGLAYLLSTNNVNYETLLPGIAGVGTNANSFVNGAWRPGIDKVTFVSEPIDPLTGEFFSPVTNQFTDTYITNGMVRQQQVARVISRPDILFAAGDINAGVPYVLLYSRTGTTNWINNAALNGNPSGAGPGMIQPPIVITFNKPGRQFVSSGSYSDTVAIDESQFLGSFDASTNAPIAYPISQGGPGTSTVRMWLTIGSTQEHFEWQPASTNGAVFAMQTSTDLANWTTLFTVTNNGSVCTYFVYNPASAQRFYRLVPQ